MSQAVRMVWHAFRRDTQVNGWFWRLMLLVLVFDAGLWALGDIVGPMWSTVLAAGVLVIWFLSIVHVHLMHKMTDQMTTNGWETFLDGREELGEYEELGGTYETADEDDD